MARRFRQVVDLYTSGKVVLLRDGSPVWMQSLNPFEQDTARNEAQIAKARLTLALKEIDSGEQAKVRMFFMEEGIEAARAKVIDAKIAEAMPKMLERVRNDPEWTERLDILERGLDSTARVPEPSERDLITKLSEEYTAEISKRLGSEREYQEARFDLASEVDLWEEYLDWYLARRGSEIQLAEYRMHQLYFGARWCEAIDDGEGDWSHEDCSGHRERIFASKDEVRDAPEQLVAVLMGAADDLEMTVREAKNSDRQGSSSDSSPLPSEAGESTASTPTETPVAPPGTSASPSPTLSPSSATGR